MSQAMDLGLVTTRSESSGSLASKASALSSSLFSNPSSNGTTVATSDIESGRPIVTFIDYLFMVPDAGVSSDVKTAYRSLIVPLLFQALKHCAYAQKYHLQLCSAGTSKANLRPAIVISVRECKARNRIDRRLRKLSPLREALTKHVLALHVVQDNVGQAGGQVDVDNSASAAYLVLALGQDSLCRSKNVITNASGGKSSTCTNGLTWKVGTDLYVKTALHPWEIEDALSEDNVDNDDVDVDDDDDDEDDESNDGERVKTLWPFPGELPPCGASDDDDECLSDDDVLELGCDSTSYNSMRSAFTIAGGRQGPEVAIVSPTKRVKGNVKPSHIGNEADWVLCDTQQAAPGLSTDDPCMNVVGGYRITKLHQETPDTQVSVIVATHEGEVHGTIEPGEVFYVSGSRTYELRLVTLELPLGPGCSGSVVVHKDEYCGTIQVVRENVPWVYMMPAELELKEMEAVCGLIVSLPRPEPSHTKELELEWAFLNLSSDKSSITSLTTSSSGNTTSAPYDLVSTDTECSHSANRPEESSCHHIPGLDVSIESPQCVMTTPEVDRPHQETQQDDMQVSPPLDRIYNCAFDEPFGRAGRWTYVEKWSVDIPRRARQYPQAMWDLFWPKIEQSLSQGIPQKDALRQIEVDEEAAAEEFHPVLPQLERQLRRRGLEAWGSEEYFSVFQQPFHTNPASFFKRGRVLQMEFLDQTGEIGDHVATIDNGLKQVCPNTLQLCKTSKEKNRYYDFFIPSFSISETCLTAFVSTGATNIQGNDSGGGAKYNVQGHGTSLIQSVANHSSRSDGDASADRIDKKRRSNSLLDQGPCWPDTGPQTQNDSTQIHGLSVAYSGPSNSPSFRAQLDSGSWVTFLGKAIREYLFKAVGNRDLSSSTITNLFWSSKPECYLSCPPGFVIDPNKNVDYKVLDNTVVWYHFGKGRHSSSTLREQETNWQSGSPQLGLDLEMDRLGGDLDLLLTSADPASHRDGVPRDVHILGLDTIAAHSYDEGEVIIKQLKNRQTEAICAVSGVFSIMGSLQFVFRTIDTLREMRRAQETYSELVEAMHQMHSFLGGVELKSYPISGRGRGCSRIGCSFAVCTSRKPLTVKKQHAAHYGEQGPLDDVPKPDRPPLPNDMLSDSAPSRSYRRSSVNRSISPEPALAIRLVSQQLVNELDRPKEAHCSDASQKSSSHARKKAEIYRNPVQTGSRGSLIDWLSQSQAETMERLQTTMLNFHRFSSKGVASGNSSLSAHMRAATALISNSQEVLKSVLLRTLKATDCPGHLLAGVDLQCLDLPANTNKHKPNCSTFANVLTVSDMQNPADFVMADLVFVHGLAGGSRNTWNQDRASESYWPQVWLPEGTQFENASLRSSGYDSNYDTSKMLNVHEHTKSFPRILNSPDLGDELQSPLTLVCLSRWGLEVMMLFTLSSSNTDAAVRAIVLLWARITLARWKGYGASRLEMGAVDTLKSSQG